MHDGGDRDHEQRAPFRRALTSARRGMEAGAQGTRRGDRLRREQPSEAAARSARAADASTASCRARCGRDAPMAIRIDSSARRSLARTSASDTRFASAVPSTTITAPSSRSIDWRKSPTRASCSGDRPHGFLARVLDRKLLPERTADRGQLRLRLSRVGARMQAAEEPQEVHRVADVTTADRGRARAAITTSMSRSGSGNCGGSTPTIANDSPLMPHALADRVRRRRRIAAATGDSSGPPRAARRRDRRSSCSRRPAAGVRRPARRRRWPTCGRPGAAR